MIRALASISLLLVAGCGGRTTPAASAEPSCRDIAVRGDALIAATPEAEREDATRFVAETIDLCQAPGLAVRARTCLAGAATLADARACPSLPTTGDDIGDPNRAEAPSCPDIVAKTMTWALRVDLEPEERGELEGELADACANSTPEGRRCAAKATDAIAVDQCFDEHMIDGESEEEEDLLKNPFNP